MTKTKKQETTVKTEQPAGVGYSGQVTVTVKKGNKILSTNTYKNNGSTELFKFFTYCLQGDYTQAENYRPRKIKLFYQEGEVTAARTLTSISTAVEKSNFVYTNTTATLSSFSTSTSESTANKDDRSTAVLHFLIPAAYIKKTSNITQINQICIYRDNITDNEQYSAYYLCTKKDASGNETWNTITVNNDQISLIIDWAMTIANK